MLMIGITTSRSWRWPLWSAALWPLILSSNLPLNKWSQYDWLQTKTQSATLWWGFIILCFTTCAWDSHSVQSLTVYCDCWTCLVCHGPNKMEDMRKTPGTPGLENLWWSSGDNISPQKQSLLRRSTSQKWSNSAAHKPFSFFYFHCTSTVLPLYGHQRGETTHQMDQWWSLSRNVHTNRTSAVTHGTYSWKHTEQTWPWVRKYLTHKLLKDQAFDLLYTWCNKKQSGWYSKSIKVPASSPFLQFFPKVQRAYFNFNVMI